MPRAVDERSLVLSFKKERACVCLSAFGWSEREEVWIASQGLAMTGWTMIASALSSSARAWCHSKRGAQPRGHRRLP